MRKIIYCITVLLFLFPITTFAISTESQPASIEISYINVTLNGQNINSGLIDVEPGQQLQLHIVFNYYGGKITNYPATQLRLDDGKFNGEVQALPNHFEKISDTQAAEDVIVSISSTAKMGDVIPVKFIIMGPDVDSEEGETITFAIKESSSTTSSSTDSTDSNSSQTSSTESSTTTSQTNSDSSDSTDSSSTNQSSSTTESSMDSSRSDSTDSSSSTKSDSTELTSISSSSDKLSIYSSNYDSNRSKKTDDTSNSATKSRKMAHSTASTSEHSFKLLPKTGMKTSTLGWLGLGVTNFVAAICLLRKK